jgi:hypothetical protein
MICDRTREDKQCCASRWAQADELQKARLTDNLLIGTIFARAHIDEVKKGLPAREAARKVFEHSNVFDGTCADQYVGQPFDIGIHTADNAWINRDILVFIFDVCLHSSIELWGSTTTACFALLKKIIGELGNCQCRDLGLVYGGTYDHAVAINQHHYKGIISLALLAIP